MKCRAECGACCIAPSISSPLPGMPDGKTAGEPCIHLNDDYACLIFDDPGRPEFCAKFLPSKENCGDSQADAMRILNDLESFTS